MDLRAWIGAVDRMARRAAGAEVPDDRCRASREAARHVDRLLVAATELEPVRSCLAGLSGRTR
jgi:hypothetical protein